MSEQQNSQQSEKLKVFGELQREMVAGGEIASFEASVVDVDGETSGCDANHIIKSFCDGK